MPKEQSNQHCLAIMSAVKIIIIRQKPAIAAMHGPHSVFDIGHCTVIHCDGGDVSLVDR